MRLGSSAVARRLPAVDPADRDVIQDRKVCEGPHELERAGNAQLAQAGRGQSDDPVPLEAHPAFSRPVDPGYDVE